MTEPNLRPRRKGPFRILSLDGGGILGTFTAGFLAYVEARLNELVPPDKGPIRIADYFDLIAGTSTGAIIAAGLAAGVPAATIRDFYRDQGSVVFTRGRLGFWARAKGLVANRLLRWVDTDYQGLVGPTYATEPLSDQLRSLLKHDTGRELLLGDLRRRLLLTAVQLSTGQTAVIKTPHLPGMFEHRRWTIRESVLASGAAPTYFQPAMIEERGPFADGGLWANNPSMVAVAEAVRISRECTRPEDPAFGLDDVCCLSVGTGIYRYGYDTTVPAGLKWWLVGRKIFTATMASQSQGVNHQTRFVLGDDRYRRIDFQPLPPWTIDNTDAIPLLLQEGDQAGQTHLMSHPSPGRPSIYELFFTTPTPEYVPFAPAP
jgi:uncharacterized protein